MDILNSAYAIVREATGIATLAEMQTKPDEESIMRRVRNIQDACWEIEQVYEKV